MGQYNGWTNYETWNVKLWLDNEQSTQEMCAEYAREAWSNAEGNRYSSRSQVARAALSESIKAFVEDNAPQVESMYADLLNAAMSEVNYREIANSFLEEMEPQEDEEKYESM